MSRKLARTPSFAPVFALLALAFLTACSGGGDSPPADPATPQPSPAATVDSASASYSGAVQSSPEGAWFEDATEAWGVEFVHDSGASGELLFPEMMGGGIAVFDADGDDDLDLYFVNGASANDTALDGESASGPANGRSVNRHFEQRDGRFVDATEGSGLDDAGYGTGVAVGDFDNDGAQDVYVANVGRDRLFRGQGDGTFVDATDAAGISVGDWSTSAAFCDLEPRRPPRSLRGALCDLGPRPGVHRQGGPQGVLRPRLLHDETDVLLMNNGDGTFRDASKASGISEFTGAGLGVVCEDFDDDGWADVYVANDGDPNRCG